MDESRIWVAQNKLNTCGWIHSISWIQIAFIVINWKQPASHKQMWFQYFIFSTHSQMGADRGFPGMLGCIDCMHWRWKNCPEAWHGQFTGHCHDPTIILDAVASQDLWIWHAYFGLPGSHNDLNVLQRSHLFARLAAGDAPPVNFEVNGHHYTMGYYLADGIYPSWSTFVKTLRNPQGNKRAHFAHV